MRRDTTMTFREWVMAGCPDTPQERRIRRLEALLARPGSEGERVAVQAQLDRLKGVAR